MPGAFKLDHLQPVKPILFPKFSNFFTSILGGPIPYYPRERKINSPNMSETQGIERPLPGHSNGTICSLLRYRIASLTFRGLGDGGGVGGGDGGGDDGGEEHGEEGGEDGGVDGGDRGGAGAFDGPG